MGNDQFVLHGFLSNEQSETIAEIREDFDNWFSFAGDVNQLGMRWLHEQVAPNVRTHEQFIAATLLLRAMQTYQSAVLLAERGIVSDVRSLARIISETAIAVGAIAVDPQFIDRLVADHYRHRRKMANSLLSDGALNPTLTPEQRQMLEATLSEVKQRYGETAPPKINWEVEAVKAGMTGLYLLIYRGSSGDAVHATALSLDRHVSATPEGTIEHLLFGPETNGLAKALSSAVTSILHALQVVPKLFPAPEADLIPLITHYRELAESDENVLGDPPGANGASSA